MADAHRFSRRTALALLAAPMAAAVLEACGDDSDRSAPVATAHADAGRTDARDGDVRPAVDAVEAVGMALYRELATADAVGNIVVSPASIAVALTMTMAGARGTTLTEMATVMRVSDTSTIHRSMNALTAQLAGLSRGRLELSIANSLWGQSGLTFQQPFLDVLAREYGAGLELVDYESDPEAARRAIDEWVGEQTDGRIPELLPPGSLTPDTRLTLVNAVHLLAPWETPFDPDSTSEAGFTTADGRAVRVQMMHAGLEVGYASGDGWQAVELPYADSPLAMLVFLPEEGFLDLFEATFLVTDATPYLEVQRVVLQMPRFSVASSFSLADQLAASGMPSAFDPEAADFSGMTTETPLFIGAVEHQATITCTETGTEAAAATAVEAVAGAMPGEPVELTLDRPFVFALRDRESGTIVFLGRVGDPS